MKEPGPSPAVVPGRGRRSLVAARRPNFPPPRPDQGHRRFDQPVLHAESPPAIPCAGYHPSVPLEEPLDARGHLAQALRVGRLTTKVTSVVGYAASCLGLSVELVYRWRGRAWYRTAPDGRAELVMQGQHT